MAVATERARLLSQREQKAVQTYKDIISRIPDAVSFAQQEAKDSEIAVTPEGKFALAYLTAAQQVLTPALDDAGLLTSDLLQPTGGPEYNPHRSIDEIGTAVVHTLIMQTNTIQNVWLHSEESAEWEHTHQNNDNPLQEERFVVIDPLDMTHSITKGDRTQTTGIAIFDRTGTMKAVGLASVVDDGFIFIEKRADQLHVYTTDPRQTPSDESTHDQPVRIATLTRRMYSLRNLPIFAENVGERVLDSTSGYAVLGLHNKTIDTILDPVKGNPWYETAIWGTIAQELGMPVTDKNGTPIDLSAVMRRVIEKHEGDSYRIPFVISRTPEIHKKVLSLLQ